MRLAPARGITLEGTWLTGRSTLCSHHRHHSQNGAPGESPVSPRVTAEAHDLAKRPLHDFRREEVCKLPALLEVVRRDRAGPSVSNVVHRVDLLRHQLFHCFYLNMAAARATDGRSAGAFSSQLTSPSVRHWCPADTSRVARRNLRNAAAPSVGFCQHEALRRESPDTMKIVEQGLGHTCRGKGVNAHGKRSHSIKSLAPGTNRRPLGPVVLRPRIRA